MSRNVSVHKIIVKVTIIIFLTLIVCYLSWMVWKGKARNQHFQNTDYGKKGLMRPVLYKQRKYSQVAVIKDVCQRWGYSVKPGKWQGWKVKPLPPLAAHELGYSVKPLPSAAHELHDDQDPYTRRYCELMPYRIFQNQTSDKIVDFVPILNEFVVYKANMVANGGKYIPKGFIIPDQMEQFLRFLSLPENKEKRWIQKNVVHRGNIVRDVMDLDLTETSIVQEYIGKPLIINGRKFSMGIFVAISSANPMRAYILESTLEWRFSEKEYYPENLADPRTYVTDGHELYGIKFASEVEPMKTYKLKNNYSSRKAFDVHIQKLGKDPALVFAQIYDAICDVLGKNVDQVEENSDAKTKYVELIRWDFIVDESLTVYLLEVNYMPAMSCKTTPALGKYYCHHIIYNLFRVMGLERPLQWKRSSEFHIRNTDVNIIDEICYSSRCTLCNPTDCHLCAHCLSQHQLDILKQVLYEHLYQGEARLLYPFTKSDMNKNVTPSSGNTSNLRNKFLVNWLEQKCKQDRIWCSKY